MQPAITGVIVWVFNCLLSGPFTFPFCLHSLTPTPLTNTQVAVLIFQKFTQLYINFSTFFKFLISFCITFAGLHPPPTEYPINTILVLPLWKTWLGEDSRSLLSPSFCLSFLLVISGLILIYLFRQIATAFGPCGNNRDYLFLLEKAMFDIGKLWNLGAYPSILKLFALNMHDT